MMSRNKFHYLKLKIGMYDVFPNFMNMWKGIL